MESRDLNTSSMDEDENENSTMTDPAVAQSLDRMDRTSLVQRPGSGDQRTALYARLRTIIDNATESIRTLKEENAALATQNVEMSDRVGVLEYRIRAVTSELANDELALRRSAEELEQVLNSTPTAASPQEPAARPPPHANDPGMSPSGLQTVDPSAETGPIDMAPETETAQPQPMAEAAEIAPEHEASVAHADESGEMIAPVAHTAAQTDGSYTLIAYPFVRFSDLGQFQAALQKLAGIHDVQVRRFAQGTLEMHVGYTGMTDLATTLRTLATEVEDVQEEEPNRLRVRLRTSQDT